MDTLDKTALKLISVKVSHQRERVGVKNTPSGTYLRFEYRCKVDCPRCALDKLVGPKIELLYCGKCNCRRYFLDGECEDCALTK